MANISYLLDDWVIYPEKSLIEKDGEVIHLEPKVMEVLVYLLENSNRVVSREELNENVWQSRYTSDDVITRAISVLRKKLNDQGKVHQYIKTIPKHGYLLDYTPSRNEQDLPSLDEPANDYVRFNVKKRNLFILLAIMAIAIAVWLFAFKHNDVDRIVKLRVDNFSASDELGESNLVAKSLTQQLITTLGNSKHVQVSLNNEFIDSNAVNFDYFVGGAVRRINNDFQVSMHFADAREGKVIWSQTFAGSVEDWHILVNSVANTLDYFIEVVDREGLDLDTMSVESMQTALLIYQARQLRMVSSQQNYLLSIQLLENGLRTYPNDQKVPLELGIALYRAASFFDNPDYFARMESLYGSYNQDTMPEGMAFIQGLYQYSSATIPLQQLINTGKQYAELFANQPEYHSFMASFYLQAKQYEQAESHVQKALKLQPGFSVATFYQAKLQSLMGQNQAAIDTLTTYLNFNRDDYSAKYMLAWLLVENGRFSEAINFLKPVELEKENRELRVLLAQSYFYLQLPELASQQYQKLLNQAEPLASRAIACQLAIITEVDTDSACDAQDALQDSMLYGRYQMLKGDYSKSLTIYQQIFADQKPESSQIRYSDWVDYTWLLAQTGDAVEAQQLAKQLLRDIADQQRLGYGAKGISDVILWLVLDDNEQALNALDDAIAEGWLHLYTWQYGGIHPAFTGNVSREKFAERFTYIDQALKRQRKQVVVISGKDKRNSP
ncbi:transcriptional regulator [Thalassotalea mangrovi]|uniref:OmpR/PhoB-type domain-containing protein n=1 Tax=Thalassotalea mangrovi TaxID=2572245 RepID=A0A4U1B587_9GAMM|nr:transcriptional regulator [Thalassotalea mangrovi]TKB44764.1 hypothetical protein E8M12_10740 [Thalassotalea mangrovi]